MISLRAVVTSHSRVLRTLGVGALLMAAARASRTAVLPLWADHIGLDAVSASLLFGIGAAVDVALSYPAGRLMDRRGRRGVAVASLLVFAAAHVALPLATTAVTHARWCASRLAPTPHPRTLVPSSSAPGGCVTTSGCSPVRPRSRW